MPLHPSVIASIDKERTSLAGKLLSIGKNVANLRYRIFGELVERVEAGFDRKARAEGEAPSASGVGKARRDLTVRRELKAKRRRQAALAKQGGI
jgi:hypothetical protein